MAIIIPAPIPNHVWVGPGSGPFNPNSIPFTNPTITGMTYKGLPSGTSEWEADLPVWETPFAADPKPYVYRLLYKVKASAFVSMPLYQAGPYGGIHAGEDNFKTSKGGILSFYREFARKPDSRNEFQSYVYAHQSVTYTSIVGFFPATPPYTTIAYSNASISELPVTVQSRVQYDYFDTLQPDTIPLPKAPRVILYNTIGYGIHGWGNLRAGDQILAEDATIRIWKGRIYERVMRLVEFQDLGAQL